jgi:hypothetical protein
MPSGNGQRPRIYEKVTSAYSYPSGTGIGTVYSFISPDTALKFFVLSLSWENFTGGKNINVWVFETVGIATNIIQDAFLVGTDPSPHIEWYSFKTCEVAMQIDVTMGGATSVPRKICVQSAE